MLNVRGKRRGGICLEFIFYCYLRFPASFSLIEVSVIMQSKTGTDAPGSTRPFTTSANPHERSHDLRRRAIWLSSSLTNSTFIHASIKIVRTQEKQKCRTFVVALDEAFTENVIISWLLSLVRMSLLHQRHTPQWRAACSLSSPASVQPPCHQYPQQRFQQSTAMSTPSLHRRDWNLISSGHASE